MISKKMFSEIIDNIKQQDIIDNSFGKSLETVCDSYCLYGTKNKKYDSLMILLKDIFNDKDDWISWWLYENVKKQVIFKDKSERSLKTVNQLYNFLFENMKED